MAILWCRRKLGIGTGLDERGSQSFKTEYTLKSNDPLESRSGVLLSGFLPIYGSKHPQNPTSVCVKVDAVQNKDNPCLWDAGAEWNANTSNRNPEEDQKQPDQRRAKWSGRFTPIQKSFPNDYKGVSFTDTAGTPLNPPPQIPIYVDEITIRYWKSTCNRTEDRRYLNATNTDIWNGAAANEALVATLDFDEVYEQGAYWFQYTAVILVNPILVFGDDEKALLGGWDPYRVLNAGTREIVDGKVRAIKLDNLIYDGQPWPLDENGKALVFPFNNSELFYLEFRTVKKIAFSGLGLTPPWES